MTDSPTDPNAAIRAAVAGAPRMAPLPPRRDGSTAVPALVNALTKANTKTTGYAGVALVLASYVLPAIVPDVDARIAAAHMPPLVAHAVVGCIGAVAALLGRWKRFDDEAL